MIELKPCPFCGGKAKLSNYISETEPRVMFWVDCTLCRVGTRISIGEDHREEPIAAWNRRVNDEQ